MGKHLLLALLGYFSLGVHAQVSINVEPATVNAEGSVHAADIPGYATVTNTSGFTLNLMWSRKVVSAPPEWSSWVCDQNNCYLPHVGQTPSSQPNVVEPGASMNLDYHIRPWAVQGEGVAGVGEYVVYIYEQTAPETILDSVRYFFETSTTSVGDPSDSDLRIYPNPTESYFQISGGDQIDRIAIYNLIGSLVRDFDARTASRFNVSDLHEGVYIVRLFDDEGRVVKTVRLSKR